MDMMRDKNRALEHDLARERGRVDYIEQRASQARRRYADAGASVQALMEDLAYLRGDVASVEDQLSHRGTLSEDMDYRLSSLEGQLVHVEDALVAGLTGYKLAPVVMPPEGPLPAPPTAERGEAAVQPGPSEAPPSARDPASSAGSSSALAPEVDEVDEVAESQGPASAPSASPEAGDEIKVEPAPPGPAEVLFTEGRGLFDQGKWRDAGRRFLKIRKKHSSSEHALEAQFLLSMCLYELARYKDALSEFQRVVDARGSTELSAHSMYMQGMSFVKLGTAEDREAAEIFFGDVAANWPKSSWAKKAKKKLGELRGS
jgi:TolA-binding protein